MLSANAARGSAPGDRGARQRYAWRMHLTPTTTNTSTPDDAPQDAPGGPLASEPVPLVGPLLGPVQVRSVALAVLAVLAVLYTAHWASAVIVPVLLGLMLSHALGPLVDRLQGLRLPRALAAALVLLSLVGSFGWTAYALADDATSLLKSLPAATEKVRAAVASHRQGSGSALAPERV